MKSVFGFPNRTHPIVICKRSAKEVMEVSGTRKFDHVTPILKLLQWLPIIKQLTVRSAAMVFKCLNGLAPPYLCQKFKTRSEVHDCNTRNRDRLHIPLCRTAAVSARSPSEAKSCGIVSQTSFSLSLI